MIDIELLQKAIKLTQEGMIDDARVIYEDLLSKTPNDVYLLSAFGLFYINIGEYDKACEVLNKACNLKETFGTVSALGFAEYERGNYIKACEILEKSLSYGENPDIYNKLIMCLFENGNYKKAIEYSEKMFEKYPNDIRSKANKVKSLTKQGKLMDAEKFCIASLKENMDSPSLWFHLGYLKELLYNNDKQAKECYKAALNLGTLEAEYNIGVSCQKLGEYEEAEEHFHKMLKTFPNDINTITSLAMLYLKQKRFKEGYEKFFKRDKSRFTQLSNNYWKPGDILNKEINIICDQGYGDNIMFARYFNYLGDRKVNVGIRISLIKLFKNNFRNINFVPYENLNPEIQTVFITDLPYVLDMDFSEIPLSSGYLKSNIKEIKNDKLKVGFCWEAGSAAIRNMIQRTINIKFFEKMLNLTNIQVYSFQFEDSLHGNDKYSQIINIAKDFRDFSDTASALLAMDVIVTVDTSIAHLAGALGVKTFLLLPYVSDWRWFDNTQKTPWYESIEIFKQTNCLSWENEINNIIKRLKTNLNP